MSGKDKRREHRATSVVAAMVLLTNAYVPVGVCGGEPSPDESVRLLESNWTPGVREKEYEYFTRAGEICADFLVHAPGAADQAVVRLLNNVLAKTSASFEVGTADLLARSKLARFVTAHPAENARVRAQQADVLARFLGQIREETIDGYVPKQVYLNLAPPASSGVQIAGMAPAGISDVDARREYEAAIQTNRENNRLNQRQVILAAIGQEFGAQVVALLKREAAAGTLAASSVAELAAEAKLTAAERNAVMAGATPASPSRPSHCPPTSPRNPEDPCPR